MSLTIENWSEKIYLHPSKKLIARITHGAEITENNEFREIYYLIVTDNDHQEVTQSPFFSLSNALTSINERYFNNWELTTLKSLSPEEKKEGGCDSCSAH